MPALPSRTDIADRIDPPQSAKGFCVPRDLAMLSNRMPPPWRPPSFALLTKPFSESHNTFLKRNGASVLALQMEDVMVDFAPSISFPQSQVKTLPFSATAALSFVASLLVIAIIIFLASKTPGMSADELASRLAAFP